MNDDSEGIVCYITVNVSNFMIYAHKVITLDEVNEWNSKG